MGKLDEYTKDGSWEVTAYPSVFKNDRIKLQNLKSLLSKAQARHRGWPYPFLWEKNIKIHSSYLQSITIGDRVARHEGFRFYTNGLFYWKSAMWENFESSYGKQLFSYVDTNWTITEIILFLKRLYESILEPKEGIIIKINMKGCAGRRFYDSHTDLDGKKYNIPFMFESTHCDENNIQLEKALNCSTLEATWQDIAIEFIGNVCTLFNVEKIKNDDIMQLQNTLLKMKMI